MMACDVGPRPSRYRFTEVAISRRLRLTKALYNSDFEGAHGGFALLRDENHRHGAGSCTNSTHSAAHELAVLGTTRNGDTH